MCPSDRTKNHWPFDSMDNGATVIIDAGRARSAQSMIKHATYRNIATFVGMRMENGSYVITKLPVGLSGWVARLIVAVRFSDGVYRIGNRIDVVTSNGLICGNIGIKSLDGALRLGYVSIEADSSVVLTAEGRALFTPLASLTFDVPRDTVRRVKEAVSEIVSDYHRHHT